MIIHHLEILIQIVHRDFRADALIWRHFLGHGKVANNDSTSENNASNS